MADSFKSSDPRTEITRQGLVGPLRRDQKSDFANASGFGLMKANIAQTLGTQAATENSPGDVAWDGTLGSRVHLALHRNGSPALDEAIRYYATEAVRVAEPHANITSAKVVRKGNKTTIDVRFIPTDGNGNAIGEEQGLDVPVPEQ